MKSFHAYLIFLALAGCEATDVSTGSPARASAQAASHQSVEERALAAARIRSGLHDAPSIWQQQSANGVTVCGAIRRENGQPIFYQYAPQTDSALILQVSQMAEPEVTALINQSNAAVASSCADHGIAAPTQ